MLVISGLLFTPTTSGVYTYISHSRLIQFMFSGHGSKLSISLTTFAECRRVFNLNLKARLIYMSWIGGVNLELFCCINGRNGSWWWSWLLVQWDWEVEWLWRWVIPCQLFCYSHNPSPMGCVRASNRGVKKLIIFSMSFATARLHSHKWRLWMMLYIHDFCFGS